jgi:hypothetical protein
MALLTQPDDGGDVVIVDIPEEETSKEEQTLSTVFSELEDNTADVLIKVYRVNEAGREAHCFDTGPDDLDGIEDRLRDAYGKGDYKLKAYAPTGEHGRKSIRKVVKLSLETPKVPEAVPDKSTDLSATLLEVTRTMTENQQNMMNHFREQTLESQLRMQELMIQMMSNKPEGPTLSDQITLIKQLMPEQANPMDMLNTVFDLNSKVQDMAQPQPSTPLGELTSGINSLVKLAANSPKAGAGGANKQPALPPGVQSAQMPLAPGPGPGQARAPGPGQQPQHPQHPQQPQQPRAQSQPQTGETVNPFVTNEIRNQLRFLMQKAIDNKNPGVYADLLVEEMNPEYYPLLVEAVGEDDEHALQKFAEIEPGILQFPQWFKAFASIIREMFNEGDDEQLDENGLNAIAEKGDNGVIVDSESQRDVNTSTPIAPGQ